MLGSDELYREWGYTALSRHRHSARFYVTAATRVPQRTGRRPLEAGPTRRAGSRGCWRRSRAKRLAIEPAASQRSGGTPSGRRSHEAQDPLARDRRRASTGRAASAWSCDDGRARRRSRCPRSRARSRRCCGRARPRRRSGSSPPGGRRAASTSTAAGSTRTRASSASSGSAPARGRGCASTRPSSRSTSCRAHARPSARSDRRRPDDHCCRYSRSRRRGVGSRRRYLMPRTSQPARSSSASAATGRVFALRFRAYGRRHFVTLGGAARAGRARRPRPSCATSWPTSSAALWAPERRAAGRGAGDADVPRVRLGVARGPPCRAARRARSPTTRWQLCNHLLPFFHRHRLPQITVAEVDRYREFKVRERSCSAESINKTITRLGPDPRRRRGARPDRAQPGPRQHPQPQAQDEAASGPSTSTRPSRSSR